MKIGTRFMTGMAIGAVTGVTVATGAYFFAPSVEFSGEWSWLNEWNQIGVALAAGWFMFVLSLVLNPFRLRQSRSRMSQPISTQCPECGAMEIRVTNVFSNKHDRGEEWVTRDVCGACEE